MLELWKKTLQLPSNNDVAFNNIALSIFQFQFQNNEIYREFATIAGYNLTTIRHWQDIPFLPVSFFKSHQIISAAYKKETPSLHFESSGTTGLETSRHHLLNPSIYEDSFMHTFRQFYGDPNDYLFICLLPSYLERNHSSLVYMCDRLIKESKHPDSGFFLNNWAAMHQILQRKPTNKRIFVIGVTYALLDFAAAYPQDLSEAVIMETGGMKGRKEEWTRSQVHDFLKLQFNADFIHSEYGMTELLSQAYAKKDGTFYCPPFMKILLRDINDPKTTMTTGTGLINVIDLANIYSCSFIAVDDIGKVYEDGSFEVLGRNDNSALRGCSLLAV